MSWSSIILEHGAPEIGTEGGTIVLDDVHDIGARITLERLAGDTNFAITCGIYGWMVHTRFFGNEHDALLAFDLMKFDLDAILQNIPLNTDPEKDAKMGTASDAMSAFVDKYPT